MNLRHSWLLLALPSLLGCSGLLVVALSFAAAAFSCLLLCGLALMPLRRHLTPTGQVIASLLIAATLLSCASVLLQMHSHELYRSVALFLPLLALPCAGLALGGGSTVWGGLRAGLGIASLAIVLGILREALGQATLLQHANWLFGDQAHDWPITLTGLPAMPLLATVSGGFILLGVLLALVRYFPPAIQERP